MLVNPLSQLNSTEENRSKNGINLMVKVTSSENDRQK